MVGAASLADALLEPIEGGLVVGDDEARDAGELDLVAARDQSVAANPVTVVEAAQGVVEGDGLAIDDEGERAVAALLDIDCVAAVLQRDLSHVVIDDRAAGRAESTQPPAVECDRGRGALQPW